MSPLTPKLPPGVRRFFRLPQSRGRLIREMDEEVELHLAMRIDELRALGMSDADAEVEARRRFGDSEAFRDYALRRAERRAHRLDVARWVDESAQNVRVALRQFRQAPALSVVVVLTLALCIGATTAVYSVVRHLLLAPLPYADGNRIVSLETRRANEGDLRWDIAADLFRLWVARSRTLQDFAAHENARFPLGGDPARDSVRVALVTPSFLPMLRVRPRLGRGFTPDDERRGAPNVAMISEGMWRERFGGEANVVGRSLDVNRLPRTIIGVVPDGVGAPAQDEQPPAVWLPLNIDSSKSVSGFARLRPGVSSAAATRELQSILQTLPDTGWLRERRAEARTARDRVDPKRQRGVELLFAAAAGLLIIACADVAGLLLMRGWSRRREFAMRQTLGASRGRLARQLLTESLLLSVPGAALGVPVAWIGLRAAGYLTVASLDAATLLWTTAASMGTALLFGVGPALLAGGGRSLDVALRTAGSWDRGSGTAGRAHAAVVVGQIALSLVFLAAAGVLVRSFVALVRTPIGYVPAGLFAVQVERTPAPARHLTSAERVAAQTLRETLAATPGVTEVAVGTAPMTNMGMGPTAVDGPTGVRPVGPQVTGMAYVSPEYFRVTRIAIVRGRGLDPDPATAAGEVVINQLLARRLWPDRDAVGARLRLGDGADATWLTVVGVAGDVRMPGVTDEFFGLQMYRPAGAAPRFDGSLVLRAQGDAAMLRPVLAQAVERAGVGATLRNVLAAGSALEYAYRGPRFAVSLFGAFALLAIVLAAVGLFGIIAFAVARRTREIGIRVALGADPAALTRTILGQSLRLVAVGCVIGILGAFGAGRALATVVYDVRPTDPAALGAAVVLLAVVALAASAVPVRRALRIDPTDALRAD